MVSWRGVIGMTPDRLVSPTVGLIPTTELSTDGQIMEPAVSDPSVTAAMFAAAATPGPALDPHGVTDRTYGFYNATHYQICDAMYYLSNIVF